MTRDEAQTAITAKLAQLSEFEAIKAYAALRAAVIGAHARGKPVDRSTAQAMVLTGNALEARIGGEAFDQLMDQIDATCRPLEDSQPSRGPSTPSAFNGDLDTAPLPGLS